METNGYVSLVAKQLAEALDALQCTIRIPNGDTLELAAVYGVDVENREKRISLHGTLAGESFRTGEVISIADISKDERYSLFQLAKNGNPKSVLAIPIKFEDDLVGVAQVYAREPFSGEQIFLATGLLALAGLALNYERTQKMSRKTLLRVMNAISKDTTFLDTFNHLVQEIASILQISRCAIYRVEEMEDRERYCEIVAGIPADDKAHGIGHRDKLADHPDILSAAQNDSVKVIDDPSLHPLTSYFKGIIDQNEIHAILYAPVSFNGGIIGVIVVDASGEEKLGFTHEEVLFCSEIAQHIALILYRDDCVIQELRHEVINRITNVGGYVKLMVKSLAEGDISKAKEYALIILQETEKMESIIPKIKSLV